MTNPSGLCQPLPSIYNAEPLFPRGGPLDDRRLNELSRDRQAWPRWLRETDRQQALHRTAAVKHHLRAMAGRDEMRSTYEHDFGASVRPFDAPSSGARTPAHDLSRTRPLADDPARRRRAHALSQTAAAMDREDRGSVRSYGSRSSVGSAALHDPMSATQSRAFSTPSLWPSTEAKLMTMKSGGTPMQLPLRGWAASQWSQHTHPHMVTGFSDKRVGLVQQANIMNLRAPDVPFATR